MNSVFLTPGPTEVHSIVKQAIKDALDSGIGSISHRSKQFEEILFHAETQLRKLLVIPKDHRVFFLSSGTECWERIIQNGVEKNSLHLVNGSFSKRFYETAQELGKTPTLCEKSVGQGFELTDIPGNLKTELICLTQNETSTGVRLPDDFIENLRKIQKNVLIAVDAVSSAPYAKQDLRSVDYYFFAVQKLFCLPAGLSILIVSPTAIAKAKQLKKKKFSIGSHHSFLSLDYFAEKHQTPCTPSVLEIYALGIMTEYLNKLGIEKLREQTKQKAELLYDCLDQHKKFKAFVQNKSWRSDTVITVDTGAQTKQVIKSLAENNLIVGSGYGPLKDSQFRVANFSAHRIEDFQKLCKILDS